MPVAAVVTLTWQASRPWTAVVGALEAPSAGSDTVKDAPVLANAAAAGVLPFSVSTAGVTRRFTPASAPPQESAASSPGPRVTGTASFTTAGGSAGDTRYRVGDAVLAAVALPALALALLVSSASVAPATLCSRASVAAVRIEPPAEDTTASNWEPPLLLVELVTLRGSGDGDALALEALAADTAAASCATPAEKRLARDIPPLAVLSVLVTLDDAGSRTVQPAVVPGDDGSASDADATAAPAPPCPRAATLTPSGARSPLAAAAAERVARLNASVGVNAARSAAASCSVAREPPAVADVTGSCSVPRRTCVAVVAFEGARLTPHSS